MSLRIAAIVPVFNRSRVALEALDSVLAQSLPPAQLIVVDDGSTDDTAARVEEWIAAKRPPFETRLIRQTNQGAAVARNRGAAEAPSGEVLAFLDSDDLWPPDYLRRVHDAFASRPDVVATIVDRMSHYYATGARSLHGYARYTDGGVNITTRLFIDGPPGTPNTAFRARAFQQAGGYDAQWPTGQDYDLMLRVSLLGPWLHVPGAPVTARNHLELVAGSGEPPLSKKFDDRIFRRAQMLHRFIFECGGAVAVPEKLWRGRLGEIWFRAGRKLAALRRHDDARACYRRTLELCPWHLRARLRLHLTS